MRPPFGGVPYDDASTMSPTHSIETGCAFFGGVFAVVVGSAGVVVVVVVLVESSGPELVVGPLPVRSPLGSLDPLTTAPSAAPAPSATTSSATARRRLTWERRLACARLRPSAASERSSPVTPAPTRARTRPASGSMRA